MDDLCRRVNIQLLLLVNFVQTHDFEFGIYFFCKISSMPNCRRINHVYVFARLTLTENDF